MCVQRRSSSARRTVCFIAWMCLAGCTPRQEAAHILRPLANPAEDAVVDAYGAIVRGSTTRKEMALVFTGDEFADGGEHILRALRDHEIKASFFLTGNFYSNPAFKSLIVELNKEGHYLGAHSDEHLLYADWEVRDSLLVTEAEFKSDLLANYERMEAFGIDAADAAYFMPPYEWYNRVIAKWTSELGLQLINFTPGTRSPADYTYPEMGARYVSSDEIYHSIMRQEKNDPAGLNGFILLLHVGTDARRKDKFYLMLDGLLTELSEKGYRFKTVTELLDTKER